MCRCVPTYFWAKVWILQVLEITCWCSFNVLWVLSSMGVLIRAVRARFSTGEEQN